MTDLAPGVRGFELDGHFVVVVPARNRLLILNESARCLFEAVLGGATERDLPDLLVDRYGIDRARAGRDVAATLAEWRDAGAFGEQPVPGRLPPPPPPARPAGFSALYRFGGRPVRVEVDDPDLAAALERLLAPIRAPPSPGLSGTSIAVRTVAAPDGSFVVHRGESQFRRAADHDLALGEIINALVDLIHPGVRWLAIIHAAAVVMKGGAIVLAAPSGSGKSTLCAALTARGHRYMSDDLVPLAADGMAYPVPLAQSLKRGSWHALAGRVPGLPDPEDGEAGRAAEHFRSVGRAMTASQPAGIARFVVPRYRPNAPLEHRPLDPFSVFTHVVRARSWVSLERDDLERMVGIIRDASGFELIYGSLDEAIAFLERPPGK